MKGFQKAFERLSKGPCKAFKGSLKAYIRLAFKYSVFMEPKSAAQYTKKKRRGATHIVIAKRHILAPWKALDP